MSSSGRNGTLTGAKAGRTSDKRRAGSTARAPSLDEPAKKLAQADDHLRGRLYTVRRAHQHINRAEPLLLQAESLADATLDAITHDGARRVPARDQEAKPRRSAVASPHIHGVAVQVAPRAVSQQPFEVGLLPQPACGIQPEALAGRGYSPSRRRPRARRLRSTLRPPAVRLRTRKPWRRARRVLEGW